MRVRPFAGRVFSDTEGHTGDPAVGIVSYKFWQLYSGGRSAIGSVLSVDGQPITVIGVMPAGFDFPGKTDLWRPMAVPAPPQVINLAVGFPPLRHTIARLVRGVTPAGANTDLEVLRTVRMGTGDAGRQAGGGAGEVASGRPMVVPLRQELMGDGAKGLVLLLGAAGFLAFIASLNMATLYMSQGSVRTQEMAVRLALGATRRRLVWQMLVEALLLALVGCAGGLAVASATLGVWRRLMPPALDSLVPPGIDARVCAVAILLALATSVGAAVWPAVAIARRQHTDSLRLHDAGVNSQRRRTRSRFALLTIEFACVTVLLIGAGLMIRSYGQLTSVDTGFDPSHAITMKLDLGPAARSPAQRRQQLSAILEKIASVPGVQAVGAAGGLPLDSASALGVGLHAEGVPDRAPGTRPRTATYLAVSAGYFDAMGIRLVAGTAGQLDAADSSGGQDVVVINQALADSLWPGEDPIGKWIAWDGSGQKRTVIGVAANVRFFQLQRPPGPQAYTPIGRVPPASVVLVARGQPGPGPLISAVRGAARQADPEQPTFDERSLEDIASAAAAPERLNRTLFSIFGVFALIVAAGGVYGVIQEDMGHRTWEFGLRAALGASSGNLVMLALKELLWVVLAGLMAGGVVAWGSARLLQSQVYGVSVHDIRTWVFAAVVVVGAVCVAAAGPVWRAAARGVNGMARPR